MDNVIDEGLNECPYYIEVKNERLKRYPQLSIMDDDEYGDFLENITEEERYQINEIATKKIGYGKNKIVITELSRRFYYPENFKNLLEWDIHHWNRQNDFMKSDNYDKGEYTFFYSLGGDWFNFIYNDKLYYGFLNSLHSYLYNIMDNELFDLISKEIPYDVVLEEGKPDENGFVPVNFRKEVHGGHEADLEKAFNMYDECFIIEKTNHYTEAMEFVKNLIDNSNCKMKTFRIDDFTKECDKQSYFIFSDESILKEITFDNFLDDFKKYESSNNELAEMVLKCKEKVNEYFNEILKEIGR